MNMGMSRIVGSKGRYASMLSAAYSAKLEMRVSDDFQMRSCQAMQASAKRWANSTEGRAPNVASKKPALGSNGAKNRATLDAALNGPKSLTANDRNRATLAAINATKPQNSSEKNRAILAAMLRD